MRRIVLVLALACVAGCYRTPPDPGACDVGCDLAADPRCPLGLECGADNRCFAVGAELDCSLHSTHPDASIVDTAPGCYGFALGDFLAECDVGGPSDMTLVTGLSTDSMCTKHHAQSDGNPVCLVIGHDITIDTVVHVVGSLPLVLLATGTLKITSTGMLDVSSSATTPPGGRIAPGADHLECVVSDGAADIDGGGGGAGGGFGATGGKGGAGHSPGGNQTAFVTPTKLRGGCRGSTGGPSDNAGTAGGHSGGAVYLIAGERLDIDGGVFAGGSGAVAALPRSGGGGGGSGGMIVLEAPAGTLGSSSVLLADGGGGSGGAGDTSPAGGGGDASTPGTTGAAAAAAPGGDATVTTGGASGAGGAGSFGSGKDGMPGVTAISMNPGFGVGGGGGGGSAGYVFVRGQFVMHGKISPPFIPH